MRLTPLAESMEAASTITAPPAPNIDWRMAKWNGSSRCNRAAAAGLEVKDSTTPVTIRSAVAPSSR